MEKKWYCVPSFNAREDYGLKFYLTAYTPKDKDSVELSPKKWFNMDVLDRRGDKSCWLYPNMIGCFVSALPIAYFAYLYIMHKKTVTTKLDAVDKNRDYELTEIQAYLADVSEA